MGSEHVKYLFFHSLSANVHLELVTHKLMLCSVYLIGISCSYQEPLFWHDSCSRWHLNGACTLIEEAIWQILLYFACHCPVFEIDIEEAFMAPETLSLQNLIFQFTNISGNTGHWMMIIHILQLLWCQGSIFDTAKCSLQFKIYKCADCMITLTSSSKLSSSSLVDVQQEE